MDNPSAPAHIPSSPAEYIELPEESKPEEYTLYVSGVSQAATEDELREAFSPFGNLCRCQIMTDPRSTDGHRGFAFVAFTEKSDGDKALQEMNGKDLKGKVLVVEVAKRSRPHSPTPGKYQGRRERPSRRRHEPSRRMRRRPRSPSWKKDDRYHYEGSRGTRDRHDRRDYRESDSHHEHSSRDTFYPPPRDSKDSYSTNAYSQPPASSLTYSPYPPYHPPTYSQQAPDQASYRPMAEEYRPSEQYRPLSSSSETYRPPQQYRPAAPYVPERPTFYPPPPRR